MRCLSLLLVLLIALAATTADARRRQRARSPAPDPATLAFEQGTRLFEKTDYQGAVKAFRRSFELKPHFLTLCNMARCHARLNDMVKAAEVYRKCLRQGGGQSAMAARLGADMARVEARITTLRVTSTGVGGTVHLNGRAMGPAPQTLSLNPGTHVVEVRREGAQPASRTVEARGGQHAVELTPVALPTARFLAAEPRPAVPRPRRAAPAPVPRNERRSGLSRAWFWVGVAATVGAAAAATAMGVLTNTARDDFNDAPTWDRYHRVNDYRLVTNILWGATAAVGVTTSVLFFFTDFGGPRQAEGDGELTLGIGINGSF